MSLEPATWQRRLRAVLPGSSPRQGTRSPLWRVFVPVAFLVAGALFVTSAVSSDGTDLRAGRYADLPGLVRQQSQDLDALRARAKKLSEEVRALSARVGDKEVEETQALAASLRMPAGLVPVQGPGLTITLDDAPESAIESSEIDPGLLVVHQQDIQAVANAMWAGGAEAMTIQGQRVISTTGIKCVGNTVVLHGVPYAPPYVISAVGDPEAMLTSVNESHYIDIYKQYVEAGQLGYEVDPEAHVELPGYDGPVALDFARSAENPPDGSQDSDI